MKSDACDHVSIFHFDAVQPKVTLKCAHFVVTFIFYYTVSSDIIIIKKTTPFKPSKCLIYCNIFPSSGMWLTVCLGLGRDIPQLCTRNIVWSSNFPGACHNLYECREGPTSVDTHLEHMWAYGPSSHTPAAFAGKYPPSLTVCDMRLTVGVQSHMQGFSTGFKTQTFDGFLLLCTGLCVVWCNFIFI